MRHGAPRLRDITLEITQKCFQNCIFCSSESIDENNVEIKYEKVVEILDDFKTLKGTTLEISGGEPFAYKKIYKTVEYANSLGLSIHFFTSASVNLQDIDFSALEGITRFYVNLQAPNSDVHDYLTDRKGSFLDAMNFIKHCKDLGFWVGTHIIPFSMNIDEMDEYMKLASKLDLDNVSLLRFVPQGRGRNIDDVLKLNNDEILRLYDLVEEYVDGSDIEFKIGCPLDFRFIYKRGKSPKPCLSGINRCVIKSNGKVIPCPAFKDSEEFTAGNIHTESLVNIWKQSQVFEKIRDFDLRKLKGLCSKCIFLKSCKGRCHAQRKHEYEDWMQGPDPYCPLYINQIETDFI